MVLFAFGVNHRTAPVAFRERISFRQETLHSALTELVGCEGVDEAAILSTCNRTDLFCGLSHGDGREALDWFQYAQSLTSSEIQRYVYTYRCESVVRHMLRVASGLDSMVLGEPQILGQVKEAYTEAVKTGTLGRILRRLFQHAFTVAKRVRTDTAIGSSPVSVAFAAVSLAKQIFGDLSAQTALVIGAGETIELAARHLRKNSIGRLVVANRTLENAHRIAAQFDGYAIALNELTPHLADADFIITSTASTTPIISLEHLSDAIKKRKRRPILIVDIAVPRDVDPRAGELTDIYHYSVDDLREVINSGVRSRQEAAHQAEEIIDTQVDHFMDWLGALDVVSAIRSLRDEAEHTRDEVLAQAERMLLRGVPADQVIKLLAHRLTNKLLHTPTVQLRQAAAQGRDDIISAAHLLFSLSHAREDDNTQ